MKKKVGIIMGGLGSERAISLKTGAAFVKAVEKLQLPFEVIDAGADLPQKLSQTKIDCALIALHGKYGEDGTVQGILEYLKIPYTGSGVLASALAMNKTATKQILSHWGVPNAEYELIDLHGADSEQGHLSREASPPLTEKNNALSGCGLNVRSQRSDLGVAKTSGALNIDSTQLKKLKFPVVVKPIHEGSAVGVTIAHNQQEFTAGLKLAGQFDRIILVERYIDGMEVSVPIWFDRVLPIIEIIPKDGFYDFERKYTPGMSEHIIPARLTPEIKKKCEA